MTGADHQPIVWRRVLRLLGGLRPTQGPADYALIGLFVAWLVLTSLPATVPDRTGAPGLLAADFWLLLMAYCLHIAGGLLNRGWRVLPVSARERRAAAWALISVLPLALGLVVTLGDTGIAALMGHPIAARDILTLFGPRALAVETYALVAIAFGNWPGTAGYFWLVSHRRPRDWMMVILMVAIVGVMVLAGGRLSALPQAGLVTTIVAVAMCALLLPLALRVIRLDRPLHDEGVFERLTDWLQRSFGLRLSGWSGHFVRQGLRTAGLWVVVVGFVAVAQWLLPPGQPGDEGSAFREGFRQGLTFGTASKAWLMPAVAGVLIAVMGQQYLLRGRLLLLSLPRGDWLVLLTPVFSGVLAFVATLLLVWPQVVTEPHWPLKLMVCGLGALALINLTLGVNLGVTSHAGIMRNGMLIGIAAGGLGFSSALSETSHRDPLVVLAVLGVSELVVLIAAIWWCRWQLRHSRAPYRPWPGTTGGWRAA